MNRAKQLFASMSQEKYAPCMSLFHSKMDTNAQISMLKSFAEQHSSYILIATNALQSIHLRNVTHVINFDIPYNKTLMTTLEPSYNKMVRRIGRSEEEAQCVVLHMCGSQSDTQALRLFELYFNVDIVPLDLTPKTPVQAL